jgi:hypothetical protein
VSTEQLMRVFQLQRTGVRLGRKRDESGRRLVLHALAVRFSRDAPAAQANEDQMLPAALGQGTRCRSAVATLKVDHRPAEPPAGYAHAFRALFEEIHRRLAARCIDAQ